MKQSRANGTEPEVDYTEFLAAKNQKDRNNSINQIGLGIINKTIKESQFSDIWKTLFDGMLQVTKDKEQEETAEKISGLIEDFEFDSEKSRLKWANACFEVLHREWDQVEDTMKKKVYYLVWYCYINTLNALKPSKGKEFADKWNKMVLNSMLGEKLQKTATGLILHILDSYILGLLELDDLPHDVIVVLLEPFVDFLTNSNDKALNARVVDYIFKGLANQIEEGNFSNFDEEKYAEYIRKKASGKIVKEVNQKHLLAVYDIFAESDSKKETQTVKKKRGRKSKAELEALAAQETKKGKPKNGRLQDKLAKKKSDKDKKNRAKQGDDEDDEDDGKMESEDDDEEDEEEEEKETKKGKGGNKGKVVRKATMSAPKKGAAPAKRGRGRPRKNPVVEESNEDDELPEDWDEEEIDEELEDDLNEEEDDEEDEMEDSDDIPIYMKSSKQQKIFFDNMRDEYYENLKNAPKKLIAHNRKVNFQMKKNTVKEFNDKHKVAKKGDQGVLSPSKSILKIQSFGSNLVKGSKPKKGSKKKVKA